MFEAPIGTLELSQELDAYGNICDVVKTFPSTHKIIEDPVLLICNGHTTHKSIHAFPYAKENDIYILSLHHTTYTECWMPPLEVSVTEL